MVKILFISKLCFLNLVNQYNYIKIIKKKYESIRNKS